MAAGGALHNVFCFLTAPDDAEQVWEQLHGWQRSLANTVPLASFWLPQPEPVKHCAQRRSGCIFDRCVMF